MIKFSIIVPVYNVERFLSQCINSILNQKYTEYELIIVDDGSTDASGRIADDFAHTDSRIKVVHRENGGLSAARNTGMKYMTGDYVVFIDSDDFIIDNMFLENISKKLSEKNADILQIGYSRCNENGDAVLPAVNGWAERVQGQSDIKIVLDRLMRTGTYTISAWSKIVKTSVVQNNNLCFKEGVLSEDLDWSYNLFTKCSTMICIEENGYVYRERGDSISHSIKYKHLQDIVDMFNDLVRKLESEGLNEDFYYVLMGYLAYEYYICVGLSRCVNKDDTKKLLYQLQKLKKLTKYDINVKTKMCKWVYRIFGIKLASRIYYMYIVNK